ncbi:hypothetical protein RM572_06400 [Streptomyces sp. DSM 42041]|uniref:Uncharacterized protein n=1 Tax=Streptomyces hazeniae TaxID=3075538 RepID=A0ABU2NP89_9ACTN|nr:hypothetical protein [Streptomyces sp. DSM 42041]MDT0378411.1 hypothetical protein [Streptomyces sp. DSM 42041]
MSAGTVRIGDHVQTRRGRRPVRVNKMRPLRDGVRLYLADGTTYLVRSRRILRGLRRTDSTQAV